METIFERVERLRIENGYESKLALEKEAKISNGQINKMKSHTPTLKVVSKLASTLGVTVSYIYTGKDAEQTDEDSEAPSAGNLGDRAMEYGRLFNGFYRLNEANQAKILEHIKLTED